jgi:hypothetical protein
MVISNSQINSIFFAPLPFAKGGAKENVSVFYMKHCKRFLLFLNLLAIINLYIKGS